MRLRLAALPTGERAISFRSFSGVGVGEYADPAIADALASFRDVTGPQHRAQVWSSVDPSSPLATRLVQLADPGDVVLGAGRMPAACTTGRPCDGLALHGRLQLGQIIRFSPRAIVRIVGIGAIRPGTLDLGDALGERALLVAGLTQHSAPSRAEAAASSSRRRHCGRTPCTPAACARSASGSASPSSAWDAAIPSSTRALQSPCSTTSQTATPSRTIACSSSRASRPRSSSRSSRSWPRPAARRTNASATSS